MTEKQKKRVVVFQNNTPDGFAEQCKNYLNDGYHLAYAGRDGGFFWAMFVADKKDLPSNR
ncbi:MAG: hypothetical protein ACR2QC_06650 [Gammaproteobacteria bacterium]